MREGRENESPVVWSGMKRPDGTQSEKKKKVEKR